MGMNKIYLYNTGSYAKERLISMLASDRIGCNPDFLDDMKHTIKQEIDRYINVRYRYPGQGAYASGIYSIVKRGYREEG
jgi:hypothetical protein